MTSLLPDDYADVIADLKERVRSSRRNAVAAVNQQLIALDFEIGRHLATREQVWGGQVVERLARDLRAELPDMQGSSRTNLYNMRRVYSAWSDAPERVQHAVGQIRGAITWCSSASSTAPRSARRGRTSPRDGLSGSWRQQPAAGRAWAVEASGG